MGESKLQALIARARAATRSYPQYVEQLAEGGVDRYCVDVATHTIDWQAGDLCFREHGAPVVAAGMAAPPFADERFVQALRRNQRGESDYATFLRESFAAGVVAYVADLRARTVSYRGRDGERYVEAIPPAG